MNLPKVVTELIEAQNSFNSEAFANCFAEKGVMIDEGHSYTGRKKIQALIDETNKKYQSIMNPINYVEDGASSVLAAECSGTFPGSPAVLKFHFKIVDGEIHHLKVTG